MDGCSQRLSSVRHPASASLAGEPDAARRKPHLAGAGSWTLISNDVAIVTSQPGTLQLLLHTGSSSGIAARRATPAALQSVVDDCPDRHDNSYISDRAVPRTVRRYTSRARVDAPSTPGLQTFIATLHVPLLPNAHLASSSACRRPLLRDGVFAVSWDWVVSHPQPRRGRFVTSSNLTRPWCCSCLGPSPLEPVFLECRNLEVTTGSTTAWEVSLTPASCTATITQLQVAMFLC